jgi:hypothetical protein
MSPEEEKALHEAKLAILRGIKLLAESKPHGGELVPQASEVEKLANAYALLNQFASEEVHVA